jgi:hypothetical protein
MNRRERWQAVMDAELAKWSAKPYEQLLVELAEMQVYEVEFDSIVHQVEIEIIRRHRDRIEISVSVDDGSLPASLKPATAIFTSGVNQPTS